MNKFARIFDTVGELSKRRTYAFHSTEYKELTRLRLNSPTVSWSPKAHELLSIVYLCVAQKSCI